MAELYQTTPFSDLVGKTITKIDGLKKDSDEVDFECSDGTKYRMYHENDCCESVYLEDITEGALEALEGATVLRADEAENPPDSPPQLSHYDDSHTWTFYRIQTNRGSVVLRWYGTSNGYYSESVSFKTNREPKDDSISVEM